MIKIQLALEEIIGPTLILNSNKRIDNKIARIRTTNDIKHKIEEIQ